MKISDFKSTTSYVNDTEIQSILNLLRKGDTFIKDNSQKEAVLVLGNSKSGKTTLTQFIVANDDTSYTKKNGRDILFSNLNVTISNSDDSTLKTYLPDLIYTQSTAFYDFPGFNETRGALEDISTNYFMKSIIDSADSIKLIFTVKFPRATEPQDKLDFESLIVHAVTLIDNVEKFKNSVALIVTKVPNERIDKKYSDDSTIIEKYIVNVLNDVKNKYFGTELGAKLARFIDIILTKKDESYLKLGIFREPRKYKKLHNDKVWQTNQKSLKTLIYDNISYSTPSKDDFKYTISSNSKESVRNLKNKIDENIIVDIKNIDKEIKTWYQSQELTINDIEDLYKTFLLGHGTFAGLKNAIHKISKPQDLEKLISKCLNDLHITISSANLFSLTDKITYLQFIENVVNEPIKLSVNRWAKESANIRKYLNGSRKWYAFLIKLNEVLEDYNVQKNVETFTNSEELTKLLDRIADTINHKLDTEEKIKNDQKQGITKDLKFFLNKVGNKKLTEKYLNIEDVELDKLKLKSLDNILHSTLRYKVEPTCENNKLIIQGHYLKLQDIDQSIKQIKHCFKPESIALFALNKIFIDSNLDKTGEEFLLSIVAPTWDVVKETEIILDGKNGDYWVKDPQAPHDGKHGKPGAPGGPGGNFIGIGRKFINGKNLSISVKGGVGGNGHDGHPGLYGQNGGGPMVFHTDYHKERFTCNATIRVDDYNVICYMYNTNCTDGGNGGNGGVGGKGGLAGTVTLMHMNENSEIKINNAVGRIGVAGLGGNGSRGGKPGYYTTHNKYTTHVFLGLEYTEVDYYSNSTKFKYSKTCKSGQSGKNGLNAADIQNPVKAKVVDLPVTVVNKYKKYLRENVFGNIKEKSLTEFLNQLENNESVVDLYNVSGFIKELEDLEDLFYKSSNKVLLLPFYESILLRVKNYVNKYHNNGKELTDDLKALNYLYAAILSKINSLQIRGANDLVLDIRGHVDRAIDEINKMTNLNNLAAIHQYNNDYTDSINQKISEATDFVDRTIMEEINKILDEIDEEIKKLVEETVSLQKEAKENKEKLIENQKKMQATFVLKTIFNVTKTACLLLNFLGPIGTAASVAIGAGTMVAEAFLVNDSKGAQQTLSQLPKSIEKSLTEVSDALKKKKDLFKSQVDDLKKELKNMPQADDLQDVKSKILDIDKALKHETSNKTAFDLESLKNVKNMHNDVSELLNNKTVALESKKSKNVERQLKVVKKMQTILSVTQMGVDLYNTIKDDKDKVDQASDAIKQEEAKIRQLEEYEQNIYKNIVPMCKGLRDTAIGVKSSVENKSHAALDLSKWQIQRHLADVKDQIQELTNGFKAEKHLGTFIDKLNAGITVMIKIYDRIQEYKDKKELADYISNINSNQLKQHNITDPDLNSAINRLELVIQSNIVLEKYTKIMNAFTQYVYPFAHEYLANVTITPYDHKPEDINILVQDSTRVLVHLKEKLDYTNKTLENYKGQIIDNVPFNISSTPGPFFIWKYDEVKHEITKLFNGEEITLKSDISNSKANAIKFGELKIRFRLKNKLKQDEFDQETKNFAVTMTHLGNSYYNCGNKIHSITSNNVSLHFHLDRQYNGRISNEYERYPPTLSPYATWSIMLDVDFKDTWNPIITKYKNEPMDIELEGRADCVKWGSPVCNDVLDTYYAFDETQFKTGIIHLFDKPKSKRSLGANLQRNRRSLNAHEYNSDAEKDAFTTSGASNSIKSSIINNVFNLIGSSLVAIEYFNPVNKLCQWFKKHDINAGPTDSTITNNDASAVIKLGSIQSENTGLPNISENVISNESHNVDNILLNYSLFSNQNLLLLDLIIRWKNGVKYEQENLLANKSIDSVYAQNLAYKEYVPKSN